MFIVWGCMRLSLFQFGNHMSPCSVSQRWQEWNHGSSFNQLLTFLTNTVAGKIHWNTSHCTRTRHWQNKWEMPQNKRLNIDSFHLRLARSQVSSSAWWVRPTCEMTEDWTWKRTWLNHVQTKQVKHVKHVKPSWIVLKCKSVSPTKIGIFALEFIKQG